MTRPPPAWTEDPAGPAVPEEDAYLYEPAPPADADPLAAERRAIARERAELHTQRTRLAIQLHRVTRLLAPPPAPPAAPKRKGGHPGHPERNDRLLALYEATPERLPHLQRCRLAAQALAAQVAHEAGRSPERERVMPAATARDAIAEARRRHDKLRQSRPPT